MKSNFKKYIIKTRIIVLFRVLLLFISVAFIITIISIASYNISGLSYLLHFVWIIIAYFLIKIGIKLNAKKQEKLFKLYGLSEMLHLFSMPIKDNDDLEKVLLKITNEKLTLESNDFIDNIDKMCDLNYLCFIKPKTNLDELIKQINLVNDKLGFTIRLNTSDVLNEDTDKIKNLRSHKLSTTAHDLNTIEMILEQQGYSLIHLYGHFDKTVKINGFLLSIINNKDVYEMKKPLNTRQDKLIYDYPTKYELPYSAKKIYTTCVKLISAYITMVRDDNKENYDEAWFNDNFWHANYLGSDILISFDIKNQYLTGAFRRYTNRFKEYPLKNAMDYYLLAGTNNKKLAYTKTLKYMKLSFDDNTVPVITTAIWNEEDKIYSCDKLETFIENGGALIEDIINLSDNDLQKFIKLNYNLNNMELKFASMLADAKLNGTKLSIEEIKKYFEIDELQIQFLKLLKDFDVIQKESDSEK